MISNAIGDQPQGYGPTPGFGHQPGQPPAAPGYQVPIPMGNIPSGLEYLMQIDQVLVKQKIEILEAMTGIETANKYSVKNSMGQKIFSAKEESGCCSRNCLGPSRPFTMKIYDNTKREVMEMSRPFRCSTCCFPCWLQELTVCAPPGHPIGSISQEWSICRPIFSVKDSFGSKVLAIQGPFCTVACCGDVEFKVLSRDSLVQVGKISKQWSGLAREMFTDADNFGISFPMDLDVNIKAVLVGACFLIDFMYFESPPNQNQQQANMNLATNVAANMR